MTSDPILVQAALTTPEYIPINPADIAIAGIAFLRLMNLCWNGGACACLRDWISCDNDGAPPTACDLVLSLPLPLVFSATATMHFSALLQIRR